eukprot:TRINITY_DN161321_c0_g2_i2.p1 TRINITY_DN161321_c0_g2~~TRINITY_DN161321_c0_g2_i2.p1  ORF type:complete len:329 (-),score=107.93 TRINITY_DN161321_c0_g2_i2:390-1376(-)
MCGETSPCEGIECKNGGTCMFEFGKQPQCECAIGYSGNRCETKAQTVTYFYEAEPWSECNEKCGQSGIKTRNLSCKKLDDGVITTEPSTSDMCDLVSQPNRQVGCNRFECALETRKRDFSLTLSGDNYGVMLQSGSQREKFEKQLIEELSMILNISSDRIEIISIKVNGSNELRRRRRQLSDNASSNNDDASVKFTVVPENDDQDLTTNIDNMVKDLKDPKSDVRQKSVILSKTKMDSLVIEGYSMGDGNDSNGGSGGILLIIVGVVLLLMIVGGIYGAYFVLVAQPKREEKLNVGPASETYPVKNARCQSVTNPMHNDGYFKGNDCV